MFVCYHDYQTMINLATDKYSAIGEMIEFCLQNGVVSYAQLLLFAKENRQDWFRVLCDNGTLTCKQNSIISPIALYLSVARFIMV